MSSNYDIKMDLDETLELDAIVQEWNPDTNLVSITPDDINNNYTHTGIQTKTSIFDPDDPGVYTISINGQTLKINVIDQNKLPNSVIDDFEDGNLSEYGSAGGSPNEGGSFTVTSSIDAISGNNTLNVTTNGASGWYATGSKTLPNTPSQGDRFRFFQRWDTTNSTNSGGLIAYQDPTNHIRIGYNAYNSEFMIAVISDSGNNFNSVSKSLSKEKFYEIRGKWYTDNTIEAKIGEVGYKDGNELASLSIQDGTYTDGGWGWSGGSYYPTSGVNMYFDYAASNV